MKGNKKECMAGAIRNKLISIVVAIDRIPLSTPHLIEIVKSSKESIEEIKRLCNVPIMSEIKPYSADKLPDHDHCSRCQGDLRAGDTAYCEKCWENAQKVMNDLWERLKKATEKIKEMEKVK